MSVVFEEYLLKKQIVQVNNYIRSLNYTIFYLEFDYPCNHICIHNYKLDEFKNKFDKYILPHTENNNYLKNIKYTYIY